MKKTWNKVDDKNVRTVWQLICGCDSHEAPAQVYWQVGDLEAGLPICPECGHDYEYVRTEVWS